MPSADRVKAVEKALRFHEVMGLVQFHYASSLRSREAEAKDARDAAIERLLRAFAIVKTIETERRHRRRHRRGENRLVLRRRALLAGYRQIKEFAPELVREFVAAEYYTDAELDRDFHDDFDSLFDTVRRKYKEYILFKETKAVGLQLYHARALLKACKTAGTKAKILEARMVAIRLIKEVSPEIEHGQYWVLDPDQPGLTKSRVYHAYESNMYGRLCTEPSLEEGILGESSKVRHLEAYQLAEFMQKHFNHCYDTRNSHYDDEQIPDGALNSRAWLAVEKIKSFAPELVAADECKGPWPGMDPWPVIRRVIVATVWAK